MVGKFRGVRYLVSQRDLCITLRKTFRNNVNEAGEGSSPPKLFALRISWFRTPDSCFPRPTKYVDLLSDDGVNRTVLHWLKLWDGVVFGNKMRDKAPVEKPKWQSQEDWLRYQRFQEPDYDERGFPFKKVSSYVSSVHKLSQTLVRLMSTYQLDILLVPENINEMMGTLGSKNLKLPP